MRDQEALTALETLILYVPFATIVVVTNFVLTMDLTVDPLAPVTGAGGNQELLHLGLLAIGLTGIGVFARHSLSWIGRRLDAWWDGRRADRHGAIQASAKALGMRIERDPQHNHPVFVGRRNGAWLRLHLSAKPHIIASHRLPLPSNFRLSAGTGGETLGNAVLDAMLIPRNTTDTGIDWTDTDLTALLLEALHGHPGSVIDDHTLKLRGIDADDLPAAVTLTAELVDALRVNANA